MLLCSCFCLSLESSILLLHMSKIYLYFKMQLKYHFFHKSFPDMPCTPGEDNPDKLRTPIRKEWCFIYLYIYSHWHCVWHRIGVQWTQTELYFFPSQIYKTLYFQSLLLYLPLSFLQKLGIYYILSPLLNYNVPEGRLCVLIMILSFPIYQLAQCLFRYNIYQHLLNEQMNRWRKKR